MLKILEQNKVKGSSLKVNKDCQILLFDVHVVHRTPKVSFPRRISEDDGKQVVSSLHSNVQLLFSLIKAIVLCHSRRRCRPCILKSLLSHLEACKWLLYIILIMLIVLLIWCDQTAVRVPLDMVRKEWYAKHGAEDTVKLARHYGVYEHVFGGMEFSPSVEMRVSFGEDCEVYRGNFIRPTQVSHDTNSYP